MTENVTEKEISLVIGTAGHIDHGKTSLVKAMTGVDCDRLNDEKKRGITIELGFAPLRLGDGRVVSLIDVPGHERFIRQMVAGASGIDAVLLIVAADEGVMPQTREHLSILQLLGVRSGLVAMTKIDRVDAEFAELAREDIRALLRGTFLEGSPIVPVSSSTGENLPALLAEMKNLVDKVYPRPRKGELFLPIDRAFPISGFGTVITGTAHRGIIRPDDEVKILPTGLDGRVRGVHVHGKSVAEGWAGQRVAANIAGLSVDEIQRGDVLCSAVYQSTNCFEAEVRVLDSVREALSHWQRVHLLIGTSDVLARVSLLGDKKIEPGASAPAQIFTEERIVCAFSQRFILRFYSPLDTIAGGRVLVPYSKRVSSRKAPEYRQRLSQFSQASNGSPKEAAAGRLEFLTERHGFFPLSQAALHIQESAKAAVAAAEELERAGKILILRDSARSDGKVYLMSVSKARSTELEIKGILADFHAARPAERGLPAADLRAGSLARLKLSIKEVRLLLRALELNAAAIVYDPERDCVSLPDFVPKDDEKHREQMQAVLDICRARAFQPPTVEEIQDELKCGAKAMKLTVESMRNSGEISLLSGLVLSREVEARLLEIVNDIDGEITLAAVRDATQSSRKYILPMLEHFDAKGVTRRVGEKRILRRTGG